MEANEQIYTCDFEEEIKRAKSFKQDLDNGGWRIAGKNPHATYWSKTFPEEKVPVKVLFLWKLPMSVNDFMKISHPVYQESRKKWDVSFKDFETLQVFEDGGSVDYFRSITPWPLRDRSFVLYASPPSQQLDWFGTPALALFRGHATHPSKPEGEDGLVRTLNGGNFYIVYSNERFDGSTCEVFGLSNNNYNGWVPNWESTMSRSVSRGFEIFRESIVKGVKMTYETQGQL